MSEMVEIQVEGYRIWDYDSEMKSARKAKQKHICAFSALLKTIFPF